MPNFDALQIPAPENWQDFERLCCDLWRRIWSDPTAQLNGRERQPQAGVDIFGRPGQKGEWAGVQCKLRKSLSLRDIKLEIEKAKTFEPPLSHFTIATIAPRDAKIQEEIRRLTSAQLAEGSFPVTIVSWDDIQQELSTYPDLIKKHFPQLFQFDDKVARSSWRAVRSFLPAFGSQKHIATPFMICLSLLMAASVGMWVLLPEVGLPILRRPVIAVLPLQDLSPAKLRVAFPDSRSLSAMLTDSLDKQTRIRVISFSESSLVARHIPPSRTDCIRAEALGEVRKFTGADYIVSGSFERFPKRSGAQLSLCLQRTTAENRQFLFRRTFSGDLPLIGFIEDRAREILKRAGVLTFSLSGLQRYSKSSAAVESYFEGIERLEKYEIREATVSFCQAKQIDPQFLLARLALSKAWKELGYDNRAEREAGEVRSYFIGSRIDSRESDLIEAYYYTTRQDWNNAVAFYGKLWAEYTDYIDYAIELIEAQNLAGRTKDAIASIARLQELEARGEVFISERSRARLQIQAAIASMLDDPREEMKMARAAARAAYHLRDSALEARARFLECDALRQLGQPFGSTCESAASRFRSINDQANEAKVYQVEGHLKLDERDFKGAIQLYSHALQLFSETGFQRGRADALANISYALSEAGREQQARTLCDEALGIATKVRSLNRPEIANDCAYFSAMTGDVDRAISLYQQVLKAAREKGSRLTEAAALGNLAYMLHADGRLAEAEESYIDSIRLSREIGDTGPDLSETLVHYARLQADTGAPSRARLTLQEGLAPYTDEERGELSVEFLCSMRRVLGTGEPLWKQIIAELASFHPNLCESSPVPPLDFNLSVPSAEEPADC